MGALDRLRRRRNDEVPAGPAIDVPAARADAARLADEGRLVEALDLLAAVNRAARSSEVEIELIDLRGRAARSFVSQPRSPWPPAYADPFPDLTSTLPELEASELTSEVLGGAVAHHGALVLRGLLDEDQVDQGVDAIQRAQAHRNQYDTAAPPDSWYQPCTLPGGTMVPGLRKRTGERGGTWLADSPRCTALFLDWLQSAGVVDAIAGHLGERPLFSLQKSTLRRMEPVYQFADWHQDGSFLDHDVRTMNVWTALSRCGGDFPSPGLEVAAFRVPDILSVDGGLAKHGIATTLVSDVTAQGPVLRPEFAPGDAIMFDERFLHRSYFDPDMTEARYALECWFFAPSHPSSDYIPLLV